MDQEVNQQLFFHFTLTMLHMSVIASASSWSMYFPYLKLPKHTHAKNFTNTLRNFLVMLPEVATYLKSRGMEFNYSDIGNKSSALASMAQ